MTQHVDFVLESPETNAVLLVEAKSTISPSSDWAARFARNLLEHTKLGANHYFLLVLRNKLYLWTHAPEPGTELPDFEARTEDVLEPYLTHLQKSLSDISPASFELLVKSWLTDLSQGTVPAAIEPWIESSGLGQFENAIVREEVPN